jgi:hypothetical protein
MMHDFPELTIGRVLVAPCELAARVECESALDLTIIP